MTLDGLKVFYCTLLMCVSRKCNFSHLKCVVMSLISVFPNQIERLQKYKKNDEGMP